MSKRLDILVDKLVVHALALPEAHEDFPWGERVAKVRSKVFVFFGRDGKAARLSVKLPHSAPFALDLSCAAPMGYGLGRSGWVTVTLTRGDEAPLNHLKGWVEESYRAVAPKKLAVLIGP
jgi:predicted DNA-binding protein (MmcQ/YjbR family)